jgi:hypothetical protein
MKTQNAISNLKKMTVTAFSVLVLTTGSFLKTNTELNDELISMARLEAFMNATEQSVKFEAPAVDDNLEVATATENLDILASETEASLKYEAPSTEAEELFPAMERLEMLAGVTEAALKYEAPVVEENREVAEAIENLDMLANSTEEAIRFQAPGVVDTMENDSNQPDAILVADQNKVSNK